MPITPFTEWLDLQRRLQVEAFDRDPALLEGDARADFIIWNVVALEDELHEMLQEVMWKPWLTVDRGDINRQAFIAELVDAMHFLGNLLLCVAPVERVEVPELGSSTVEHVTNVDTDQLAHELWNAYRSKVEVNLRRQLDGYDGKKDKCPICNRELNPPDYQPSAFLGWCEEHGNILRPEAPHSA